MIVVYYSLSGNVQRFVCELGLPAHRIMGSDFPDVCNSEFLLITPTYTDRIPAPVERFLKTLPQKSLCKGVIGSGNKNFGRDYGAAAKNIEKAYGIPCLYLFEVNGLQRDVAAVKQIANDCMGQGSFNVTDEKFMII